MLGGVSMAKKERKNKTENDFIASDPELAKKLNKSIDQIQRGETIEISIEELKEFEK